MVEVSLANPGVVKRPTTSPAIFLAASIPDESRWDRTFDAFEIVDAVVAFARESLTRGYRIVSAAHPTIAPLLLYVASELPSPDLHAVTIYQSTLFAEILPSATRRFEATGVGRIVWTRAVDTETPEPGNWDGSLDVMRRQMLGDESPVSAAFVGGMDGIITEFSLYRQSFPTRPVFVAGRPGGAAATILASDIEAGEVFTDDDVYPSVWRRALDQIDSSLVR